MTVMSMYIFRDFRLENCTKIASYAILRHYLTKNVHRCAIRERLEVTVHCDGYCDFSAKNGLDRKYSRSREGIRRYNAQALIFEYQN